MQRLGARPADERFPQGPSQQCTARVDAGDARTLESGVHVAVEALDIGPLGSAPRFALLCPVERPMVGAAPLLLLNPQSWPCVHAQHMSK